MKRRLFLYVSALFLILSLCACAQSADPAPSDETFAAETPGEAPEGTAPATTETTVPAENGYTPETSTAEPETDDTAAPSQTEKAPETTVSPQTEKAPETTVPPQTDKPKDPAPPPETKKGPDAGRTPFGSVTIDRFLGCTKDVASFLASHADQYLGTPYQGLFRNIDQPWVLMRYKGGYDDPHMNCAGFLSSVFQRCGGDITLLPSESGAYSNAYNWKRLVDENGITRHKFSTIEGALASGVMKKGDLIYIHPTSFETGDCHIGFFWGDSPSDNKFWNSLLRNDYTRERGYDVSGNMITPIIAESDYAYVYVIPVS